MFCGDGGQAFVQAGSLCAERHKASAAVQDAAFKRLDFKAVTKAERKKERAKGRKEGKKDAQATGRLPGPRPESAAVRPIAIATATNGEIQQFKVSKK